MCVMPIFSRVRLPFKLVTSSRISFLVVKMMFGEWREGGFQGGKGYDGEVGGII